jgi:hypothetical protein
VLFRWAHLISCFFRTRHPRLPAQCRRRCERSEPSPGADVAVPVQMWEGRAQSRRRCGDVSVPQGLEALQRIACKLVLFDDALLIARSRGGALRAANRRIQSVYSSQRRRVRSRCCASTSHRRCHKSHRQRRKSHRLRCETPSADAVNGIGRAIRQKASADAEASADACQRHPSAFGGRQPSSGARQRWALSAGVYGSSAFKFYALLQHTNLAQVRGGMHA